MEIIIQQNEKVCNINLTNSIQNKKDNFFYNNSGLIYFTTNM